MVVPITKIALVVEIGLTLVAVCLLLVIVRLMVRSYAAEDPPADLTMDDIRTMLSGGQISQKEYDRLKRIVLQRQREQAGLEPGGADGEPSGTPVDREGSQDG